MIALGQAGRQVRVVGPVPIAGRVAVMIGIAVVLFVALAMTVAMVIAVIVLLVAVTVPLGYRRSRCQGKGKHRTCAEDEPLPM